MQKIIAIKVAHSLSNPGAMPCKGYSLPAHACKTGSKLVDVEGSICSDCYAMKGRYIMPSTREALEHRLNSITDPRWVEAMVTLINNAPYFRWHDSGDLQDMEHLRRICEICSLTPYTQHWLPTRERALVRQYLTEHQFPRNLVVRLSATMFDQRPDPLPGLDTTSGAHDKHPPIGFECQKPKLDNTCGDCRACWCSDVKHVSYHRH